MNTTRKPRSLMLNRKFVRFETNVDDPAVPFGVGVIRLDRPKVNALNRAMQTELVAACHEADQSRAVKVVVVYGGQRAFAAGADVKEFATRTQGDMIREGDAISKTISAVAAIKKPVIAAVERLALGGGFEIAIAADFRVSSSNALWGLPEILLGVLPAAGGTQRLPRIVGASRAKMLMFTGESITGSAAAEIGLVDQVCDEGQALNAAFAMANRFVNRAPLALAAVKSAVDLSFDTALDVGLRAESFLSQSMYATDDARAGIESFVRNGPGTANFVGE
ncbi:enoyl-CoA hydratase/isomerase family protein [Rhodococcus erythropolis]|uniref:enoyl-CoA hydratase/isomerase family protein n=1 Tax=Rhodococcus erythropolis TaxID=1833 RepID=UPI00381C0186